MNKKRKPLELYVHIPFCIRKCAYCDFVSGPGTKAMQKEYEEALLAEIDAAEETAESEVISAFFGGGTPSAVDAGMLARVMEKLRSKYIFSEDAEITLEANPGTLDAEKLKCYRKSGFNRISIGCQSVHDVVIGGFQEQQILFVERVSTNQNATSLELAISIKTILEIYQIQTTEIEGCIISSVVPSINHAVRKAVEKIAHCPVVLVGPGVKTGLQIAIDNPAQLGSDRVADAVAALHEYQPPIVIIDMGTATTLSVIDAQRRHIGGMIAPGVGISMNALTEKTAQLPKISLDPPKRCIGSNTVECMKSGILYGAAGCIDGLLDRIEEELGETPTFLATGGLSEFIIPHCRHKIVLDNLLLLKGLQLIYQKNVEA